MRNLYSLSSWLWMCCSMAWKMSKRPSASKGFLPPSSYHIVPTLFAPSGQRQTVWAVIKTVCLVWPAAAVHPRATVTLCLYPQPAFCICLILTMSSFHRCFPTTSSEPLTQNLIMGWISTALLTSDQIQCFIVFKKFFSDCLVCLLNSSDRSYLHCDALLLNCSSNLFGKFHPTQHQCSKSLQHPQCNSLSWTQGKSPKSHNR